MTEKKQEQEVKKRPQHDFSWSAVTALSTVVLVIVTGVYVFLTNKMVDLTSEQFYQNNRPYIVIDSLNGEKDENNKAILVLHVKNFGKVPARITHTKTEILTQGYIENEVVLILHPEEIKDIRVGGINIDKIQDNGSVETRIKYYSLFDSKQEHEYCSELKYYINSSSGRINIINSAPCDE